MENGEWEKQARPTLTGFLIAANDPTINARTISENPSHTEAPTT